ncbi:non-homologous end joining protein Ku [Pedobacter metabolipauper]|uniref:Non-homologous end joining protein Ku n=1 Tax=Pedobacter metabolipauper TaxID=425513 RepID=A0A4R6SVF5_9SPHI|nr:Ku protein [Pedobacter metabolipauper]TDQ09329.1 DNA end-binding protein Ku [Pedobacter metabolipauper]
MKAVWKGSIGFGLVNIPIRLFSAVQNSNLDLDMLDGKDHSKIKFQRINENTGKVVPYERIVKGFLLRDKYVILDDDDYEDASPEKSKMIELENFVDIDEINPIYYESSYYAEPEKQGQKAYALLLKALIKSNKAGVARFVLRSTENLCVIHPMDEIIVVTKIRFPEEIRSHEEIEVPSLAAISKKELDVGLALIKQYTSDFDITGFHDEYSKELLRIIKAKAKGKRATVKKLKPREELSDDLYGQLMKSLGKKGA